jgi:hypothetical protein
LNGVTTTVLTVKVGFFPLSEQLRVVEEHFSPGVARHAVWLAGLVPYDQAAAILAQIGSMTVSASTIWRRLQQWGRQFAALEEAERAQAQALPEKWQPPSRAETSDQRLGVAMDGFMVHILDEGWKEMKLGAVFNLALRPGRDERTGERGLLAHAVNNTYAAYLGGPAVFGELVFAEARRRGWEQAQDTQVIGDGAVWIWNQAGVHFGASRQLVDWYHAKQHLAEAARCFKGEGTLAYKLWFNSHETALYQGHAERIACELEQATPAKPEWAEDLRREAGYFRQHQQRMNYLEMREEDWVIGSGMVEGGAKRYQARLCGPGMRWSRKGAETLTPVRTAILSGRFDERWRAAQNLPPA